MHGSLKRAKRRKHLHNKNSKIQIQRMHIQVLCRISKSIRLRKHKSPAAEMRKKGVSEKMVESEKIVDIGR